MPRLRSWHLELFREFLAACGDKASCRAAEEFQDVGEKISGRFGGGASQGYVEQRGNDADENTVEDEARSEAAEGPCGE